MISHFLEMFKNRHIFTRSIQKKCQFLALPKATPPSQWTLSNIWIKKKKISLLVLFFVCPTRTFRKIQMLFLSKGNKEIGFSHCHCFQLFKNYKNLKEFNILPVFCCWQCNKTQMQKCISKHCFQFTIVLLHWARVNSITAADNFLGCFK